MIDGQKLPFGVLDVHSTEPHFFTPKDVHFIQSAANVLADAIERRDADDELRHRVLHDALTGLPNRTLLVDRLDEALGRGAPTPAPRSACSSSTSTTSSWSTTASATTPATSCCARSRRGCAPTCVPATPSPASAATSS